MSIFDYIKGNKKGKQARDMELDALRDPFLSDAIEGFDSVKGEHPEAIGKLKGKIHQRSTLHLKQRDRSRRTWVSVAAVALVLMIGGGIYLFEYPQDEMILAFEQDQRKEALPTESTKLSLYFPPKIKQPIAKAERKPVISTVESVEVEDKILIAEEQQKKIEVKDVLSVPDSKLAQIEKEAETAFLQHQEETVASKQLAGRLSGVSTSEVKNFKEDSSVNVRIVKGKVTDQSGEPIYGASVSLRNTNKGVITDMDGKYSIDVSGVKNPKLSASFIGMDAVEIENPSEYQAIAMRESAALLDEVVVVGYGSQKKQTLTGSVSKVDSNTLETKPQPIIGSLAYSKYLKENRTKLSSAECENKKGKVTIAFQVDSSGTPINLRVKKALCPEADREVIRLIKEGPKWTLGTLETEVNVWF